MAKRDTKVGELCKELGVTRQTLYRFVGPKGELRADGTDRHVEAPTSSGDRGLIAFVTVTEVRDRANATLREFT
jgi:hypothetical protein